ncbi:MAG: hypothetical protein GTO51_03940 [Candidatus Latescibacteria bacterium]|nr:hypothetical protein [Candidatus Latescibacterota bacterium]NIM20991.1 hypothetical protein [Candidatus Latescibacterota bacterium]NIM65126.1 hypothetical protein [Candidatus Latescibacterota bacterium]NIO01641.1 hypothetical protein [Candidatus Latescibacterota bacterium]NIO28158.1 hypothetical protein [Candidatus Latescibacterota bacterium]
MKSRHFHKFLIALLIGGYMMAIVPWISALDSMTNEDKGERFVRMLASGSYASAWEDFDSTTKAAMPPHQIELIPRIGMLDHEIAGFVVMAGPSRPSEDAILEQMAYIYSLDGLVSDSEMEQLEKIKQQVAMVKDPWLSAEIPSKELPLGLPAEYWLDLHDYNPLETARHLNCDVLILQAGRDYQVTMEDFWGWKRALNDRQNVVFESYPKLNHLFMEGDGKSSPEEYQVAGHVAEVVIEDIANWIKSQ